MSVLVDWLGNSLPDLAILAVTAISFALFGTLVSRLSNLLWFSRWPQHGAFDEKLADTAHTSLLGFAAFVLALMITNALISLAKSESDVRQEGAAIYRLARELDALGPEAQAARASLATYVKDVASDEWPRLAMAPNGLSPRAQADLDALWANLRALQAGLPSADSRRADLTRYAERIEQQRQSRLADSTSNIPGSFWLILVAYVTVTSFLAGRETPNHFGMQINLIHMSAIGLAVGLVIILDNPFRGETSIDPAIITRALAP